MTRKPLTVIAVIAAFLASMFFSAPALADEIPTTPTSPTTPVTAAPAPRVDTLGSVYAGTYTFDASSAFGKPVTIADVAFTKDVVAEFEQSGSTISITTYNVEEAITLQYTAKDGTNTIYQNSLIVNSMSVKKPIFKIVRPWTPKKPVAKVVLMSADPAATVKTRVKASFTKYAKKVKVGPGAKFVFKVPSATFNYTFWFGGSVLDSGVHNAASKKG